MSCTVNTDCSFDKLCKAGKCVDPCSLRAACGKNALCRVVNHFPRCECPECYTGQPHVGCRLDFRCKSPVVPPGPPPGTCQTNLDCPTHLYCNAGRCASPCGHTSVCKHNEKCVAANHQASCQCKTKLVINALGELSCPDHRISGVGCEADQECPVTQACVAGTCQTPCTPSSCPTGKKCTVTNHVPLCVCDKTCSPEVSICLKDTGCPADMACKKFKCVDPCHGVTCRDGAPCVVQNHQAVCKFCPAGFKADANYGCIKGTITKKKNVKHKSYLTYCLERAASKEFSRRLTNVTCSRIQVF